MAKLLYLVHRLPYPPNKGDKVRSYHLLKYLASKHQVFLGTFIDDPEDAVHIDTVRSLCTEAHIATLHPKRARVGSLLGLLSGQALTLHYYRDAGMHAWVAGLLARERIDAAVVFSSSMAQYAQGHAGLPSVVDFVDVDSAKWRDYAPQHAWPMSWLYAREGRKLLACEQAAAAQARHAYFVTEKEAQLFRSLVGPDLQNVSAVNNGVDAEYFAPSAARPSPYGANELPVVFTGAMDYWPNVDAVTWFVNDMLPALLARWPALRFHIVGRSPTVAVRALASTHVAVSGTVPDVRPYLQHAAVVVAPLRLARGVQNKILEAMAMARPVVASAECASAIDAEVGTELLTANDASSFISQVNQLLQDGAMATRIGACAQQRVQSTYSWAAHLGQVGQHIDECLAEAS